MIAPNFYNIRGGIPTKTLYFSFLFAHHSLVLAKSLIPKSIEKKKEGKKQENKKRRKKP